MCLRFIRPGAVGLEALDVFSNFSVCCAFTHLKIGLQRNEYGRKQLLNLQQPNIRKRLLDLVLVQTAAESPIWHPAGKRLRLKLWQKPAPGLRFKIGRYNSALVGHAGRRWLFSAGCPVEQRTHRGYVLGVA